MKFTLETETLTLNSLKQLSADQLQHMIAEDYFCIFRLAAQSGYLNILQWLKEQAPDQLQNMIKAMNYHAFRQAAAYNHLDVLQWLKEQAPNKLQDMIAANDCCAFHLAAQQQYSDVVNFLFSSSFHCFAYAEMHMREYGVHYITPFVQNKLATLHESQQAFAATHPNTPFDIMDAHEAKLYFYIAKNLIRHHDETSHHNLRFLLDIPAIKTLAHTAVTDYEEPNELIRLAVRIGNGEAAETLLSIPEVAQLARQDDFYQDEARGNVNLRTLAENHESSMTALSVGEENCLKQAMQIYEPRMQAIGITHLMQELRDTLKKRYDENPATITINNNEIRLPVDWKSFQALKLDPQSYERALKAYYQHTDHTALRFLSQPNHWMAKDALYVEVDPHDDSLHWAAFDKHQKLIVMLWLAAQDITIPATDGFTIKTRVNYFIQTLADIGRAHNWDKKRTKPDGTKEEYDDMEGDKPSCFSGMKYRLFFSVLGHPLLKILTKKTITQELRTFIHRCFKEKINDTNREALLIAYQDYITHLDLTRKEIEPIKALDIDFEQQQTFFKNLIKQYGEQFSQDTQLIKYVKDELLLEEKNYHPHALKFAGFIDLEQLLKPPIAITPSNIGMFSQTTQDTGVRSLQTSQLKYQ